EPFASRVELSGRPAISIFPARRVCQPGRRARIVGSRQAFVWCSLFILPASYLMEMSFLHGGMWIPAATVEYVRYPGNSYDRQYAKFCHPYGAWSDVAPDEERFRLALGEVIVQLHLE